MSLIHYSNCPVCGSPGLEDRFPVKDYTVSKQTFPVIVCSSCSLRMTQDVPDQNAILPYYKSEDYISHTNTSKGFINSMYQRVRNRTIRKKINLVRKETGLMKGTVLDLGSGTGSYVHALKEAGWDAIGLEPDKEARLVAKSNYGLELGGMDSFMGLQEENFDAITLWHVLEHVHELKSYLQQLKKILRKEGRIFIAVPNYTSRDASVYKEYWAAYDVPRHLYHFSPKSMEKLITDQGMKILSIKPMWYDSFYISLLSSKYKHGKARIISAGWNGFISNLVALFNRKRCSSLIYVISKH